MSDALSEGLAAAEIRPAEIVSAMAAGRLDLRGCSLGAASYLLHRAQPLDASRPPVLVVAPDLKSAEQVASSLRFFAGPRDEDAPDTVLSLPHTDSTPYLDVAPDRRAAMDRLAALFHLASELPTRFVVVPAPTLARRVPPRDAVKKRSAMVQVEEELDREEFIRLLSEAGYLRVPVAEDPGTFAVRGGILDVFPPHAPYPARIDLDDWLVTSIKLFDPDDQRTIREVSRVFVHPVRDTLLGKEELARAVTGVRDLCDDMNVPTEKSRQLIDELKSGRAFYGIDGFTPAFYESLETLVDYLPTGTGAVVLDPTAVARAFDEELERAEFDRQAKVADLAPTYPLESHYLTAEEAVATLTARPLTVIHRAAMGGGDEDEAFAALEPTTAMLERGDVKSVGAEDQAPLVAMMRAQRATDPHAAMLPATMKVSEWMEAGLRVVLTARTTSQAERLVSLLKADGLEVSGKPEPFQEPELPPAGQARVLIGGLGSGFVYGAAGLVFLTEEEIFGTRGRRGGKKKRKRRSGNAQAFLQDLRELAVGDFVVHVDHGVGKYLGLQKKPIMQSGYERLKGVPQRHLEVLIIEYQKGDKLFLPVTRLNQIQKFASEGHKPKLDKLGGQSFAKKKGKAKKAVRRIADDLLKLYAKRAAITRPGLPAADRLFSEFEATFPFDETRDQAQAIDDVLGDLEGPRPMDRLVCGDVGFGKTEVAIRAAFRMAMAGRQVAILCPTTVLAQQHYLNVSRRFEGYPLEVRTLSRFVDKATSTETLAGLKSGKVDVVIGTHRLLSKDVHFKELGLLVIDEEQRFGVTHKERIKTLRSRVDVLTLSATPIPRTLQLAIGGMRDLSLITTAPVDRRAVRTFALRWDDHTLGESIRREVNRGGQVFFVYNRIDGLYERAQRLSELLPDVRFAVAHGQMKEGELERVMNGFVDGDYDVLCSTAIIESGLDIPRANTMIVDRADMFGLAQLYQLRGRVGRSRERAYCYLVTPPPRTMTDDARERIAALERFTELGSGFQVASLDMELRGVGDLLGAEQSGSVALVGFDMFVHMLEEAVAQLRGEEITQEVDTEMTVDLEHTIPEDYIADVGLRLSFYKRFAAALDVDAIAELAGEMEDRFGPPPEEALALVRVMRLRPLLREFRVLGCEALKKRVTLHLKDDTPLDPQKVMGLVTRDKRYQLSPDMKLTCRFGEEGDPVERVESVMRTLRPLC